MEEQKAYEQAAECITHGVELGDSGFMEDAMLEFQKGLLLTPDDPFIYTNIGVALVRLGRHDSGIQAHKIAIKLAPSLAVAHFNFGCALQQTGDPISALDEFYVARKLDESDPEIQRSIDQLIRDIGHTFRFYQASRGR